MPFENIHAAEKFYKEYAHDIGFAVRVGQQRKDNDIVLWKRFMCSRQGFRDKKDNAVNAPPSEGKKKRNFAETRCGCDAYIYVKLDADNRYTIQSMVDEHNHGLVSPDKRHLLIIEQEGISFLGRDLQEKPSFEQMFDGDGRGVLPSAIACGCSSEDDASGQC